MLTVYGGQSVNVSRVSGVSVCVPSVLLVRDCSARLWMVSACMDFPLCCVCAAYSASAALSGARWRMCNRRAAPKFKRKKNQLKPSGSGARRETSLFVLG